MFHCDKRESLISTPSNHSSCSPPEAFVQTLTLAISYIVVGCCPCRFTLLCFGLTLSFYLDRCVFSLGMRLNIEWTMNIGCCSIFSRKLNCSLSCYANWKTSPHSILCRFPGYLSLRVQCYKFTILNLLV